MHSAIITFTSRSASEIVASGGSQAWVLDRAKARAYEYLVCCRNRNTDWSVGDEPHQSAFLIGRISDVVPATDPDAPSRWLIKVNQYALINLPDIWQGWRNPVRYTALEDLNIDVSKISFKEIPNSTEVESDLPMRVRRMTKTNPMTIADAKRGLAATFGVPEDAVEITIRA